MKPANVMVTADGIVKVLDFGLAKAFSDDPSESSPVQSPALSVAMTQQGLVLGTAGYMSPEQASGQAADQRADIWAFGVVLYEMLTGLPLFSGESVPHILADVLKTEPDWSRLPENLHPRLKLMLERCLTKKPRNRYHSIADARVDIEAALSDPEGSVVRPVIQMPAASQPFWQRALLPVSTLIAGAAIVGALAWELIPEREPRLVTKFIHELPEGMSFNRTARGIIAVSASGDQIAYGADGGLYVRSIGELGARLIAQTAGETPRNLVFSPDGEWVVYTPGANDMLKRVSLRGGSPDVLAATAEATHGPGYGTDGTILYGQGESIVRVPAAGGEPETLVSVETGELRHPSLLPGGEYLLASHDSAGQSQVVAFRLATGELIALFTGRRPRYVDTGHIVYFDNGAIVARAFDPALLDSADVPAFGGPVELVQGVMQLASDDPPQFEIGANGTLVYIEATTEETGAGYGLAVVNAVGEVRTLDVPLSNYTFPSVSSDGKHLAVQLADAGGSDIWVYELEGQSEPRQLTSGGNSGQPAWRDNDTILFSSSRDGPSSIYERSISGGSATRLTTPKEGTEHRLPAWAPDGRLIFTLSGNEPGLPDLYAMMLPDGEPELLVGLPGAQFGVSFSIDGLAMAFSSAEALDSEVIASPYPPDGSFTRVSEQGVPSVRPVWSQREGSRRLSFQKPDLQTIEAVDITFPGFAQSNRRDITNYGGAVASLAAASIPGTDELVITWVPGVSGVTTAGITAGLYFGRIIVIENFTELLKSRFSPL